MARSSHFPRPYFKLQAWRLLTTKSCSLLPPSLDVRLLLIDLEEIEVGVPFGINDAWGQTEQPKLSPWKLSI
jgi:hypothetical protein